MKKGAIIVSILFILALLVIYVAIPKEKMMNYEQQDEFIPMEVGGMKYLVDPSKIIGVDISEGMLAKGRQK